MGEPLSVFVMYSWEDDEEMSNAYALALCNELRAYNIDASCDVMLNKSNILKKITKKIDTVDKFVIIVTPSYTQKADESKGTVGKEVELIFENLSNTADESKIVFVIKKETKMPKIWENYMRIDFTKEPKIDDLVRFLKGIGPDVREVKQDVPDPQRSNVPSLRSLYPEISGKRDRSICIINDKSDTIYSKKLKVILKDSGIEGVGVKCYLENDYVNIEEKKQIMKSASAFVVITQGTIDTSGQYYEDIFNLSWYILPDSVQRPYVLVCETSEDSIDSNIYHLLNNALRVRSSTPEETIQETSKMLLDYFGLGSKASSEQRSVRFKTSKDLYKSIPFETIRQSNQQKILAELSKDLYKRTTPLIQNGFNVLDIGSFDGTQIVGVYGTGDNFNKLGKIIGVEKDCSNYEKSLSIESDKVKFYNIDVESTDFEERLTDVCIENDIPKCQFDIINLSMILLHLQNPELLLRTLRPFLRDKGMIVIRDIDDRHTHAYPDNNRWFANAKDMCRDYCSPYFIAGDRDSGLKIHSMCINSGYLKPEIVKIGVTTTDVDKLLNIDSCPRRIFFDMYYGFIYEDMKILSKDPDKYIAEESEKRKVKESFEKLSSVYEKMRREFSQLQFSFTLGFMFLTVRK